MPIYEYRCSRCGHQQEFLQKLSDPPHTRCTKCGEESLSKMLTAAGFQLKGSGWYATDFKGGAAPAAKAEGPGAKTEGPAAKTEGAAAKTEGAGAKDGAAPACGSGGCPACQ